MIDVQPDAVGAVPAGATIRGLLDALDAAGVRWLVLRDPAAIDDPDASDIDLLVDPRGLARLSDVFRARSFVPVAVLGRGSHRSFVGLDERGSTFRRIDVVTRLEFGRWFEIAVPITDAVLGRRERRDGLWQPARVDAFWTLALHVLLDKETVPVRHRPALSSHVDAAEPSLEWARVLPGQARHAIVAAVIARDWRGLEALAGKLRVGRARRAFPWRTTLARARRIARRFEAIAAWRGRPGLIVALVGPDGAGKSTIAASVARQVPIPARVGYLGLWRDARRPRRWLPGAALVPRLVAAWRGWLAGRVRRARGWLVLFDRYPSDALLRLEPAAPVRSRLYFTLIGRSCPPPDLLLVLDAPAEVLQARKHEHPTAEIERDRRGYARLVSEHRNGRLIDADRPVHDVERDVLRAVWGELVARWPR